MEYSIKPKSLGERRIIHYPQKRIIGLYVYSMGKTATLNIRVNPDVKENAESVLAQLGIPMATAIDMYLKQISLVGGIPFSIVLPKAANSVNADMMSVTQIHQKLEKGYADIEKGNVEDAASAFVAFRERH